MNKCWGKNIIIGLIVFVTLTIWVFNQYRRHKNQTILMPWGKHPRQWLAFGAIKYKTSKNSYKVKIVIDQFKAGQERYPSIYLRIPRKHCDFRKALSIEFDAVSDNPEAYLLISISNGSNLVRYGRHSIPTQPVKIKIDINNNLSMNSEIGEVSQIIFYQCEPEHTCTIWMSNLRVNLRDDFRPYFEATHRQLALCPNPQKKLLSMDRKLLTKKRITFKEWRNFHDELKKMWTTQFERQMQSIGSKAYSAIWVSSMDKVARTDNPLLTSSETLVVDAGRREGESAQLVIYAKCDLKNLCVRLLKPLVSEDGALIPQSAVTVMPVGYVACSKPPYRTPHDGWWPDPLLAYTDTINLERGFCQPWWLDINVPKDQIPGIYNGSLLVSADNVPETEMSFSLTVHRFTLPDGSAYPMSVCYHGTSTETIGWASALPEDHPSKTHTAEWNCAVWDMMLAHRIGCDSLYHKQPINAEAAKYKLDHGARLFNICYLDTDTEKRFPDIDNAMEEYKRLGILDRAYFYGFDEAQPSTFPQMSSVIHAVRDRYPGIPILTTALDPSFGNNESSLLHDCIDWWCPVVPSFEQYFAQIAPAHQKGRQVWWYICCYPTQPYANIFIDFPGIQPRLLLGMMYQKYKPDGFLYYAVTNWRDNGKLRDYPMKGAPCTNWTGNSFKNFNGDGVLFYPGETQILPTQRLKLLRDGMEDALYFQLIEDALKNFERLPSEWREQAEQELKVEPELVASMSQFTDNPTNLLNKRSRLIRLLDELADINERVGDE